MANRNNCRLLVLIYLCRSVCLGPLFAYCAVARPIFLWCRGGISTWYIPTLSLYYLSKKHLRLV